MSLYAVNGKEPIAAWIPSRDDAGNGTTTLNDLVGTNNGTLTNMDAATDWITVGSKRAIDIDAANDKVVLAPISFTTPFSISVWALSRDVTGGGAASRSPDIFATRRLGVFGSATGVVLGRAGASGPSIVWAAETASGDYRINSYLSAWAPDELNHWIAVFDQASGNLFLYKDGALLTPASSTIVGTLAGASIGSATEACIGNRPNSDTRPLNGYFDDVRIFDQVLDATDVSDLYAAQRGGITNPPLAQYFTGIRSHNRRRKVGT